MPLKRTARLLFVAASLVLGTLLAPHAAAQSPGPVAIAGNFSDPQHAEDAVFSPDGRLLAVTRYGGGVTLWDLSSGLPLRTLMPRAYLTGTVFTNDGKRLLTAHKDGIIRIWDVESGAVLQSLRAKPRGGSTELEALIGLAIDRRGEHAITAEFGPAATVWAIGPRKQLFTVPRSEKDNLARTTRITASRISADGQRLTVLASRLYNKRDSAGTYDAKTGAELSFVDLPEDHIVVENGFIGDDEAIVLVSGDRCPAGELMLFSLKQRAVIAPVHRPANCDKPKEGEEKAFKLHASPDSNRIAISQEGDPDLRIFDTASRKIEQTLPLGAGSRVLGVSRDLKQVAIGETDRIGVRSLPAGAAMQTLRSVVVPADRMIIGANGADLIVQPERPRGSDAPFTIGIRKLDAVQGEVFKPAVPAGFTLQDVASAPRLALGTNDKGEIVVISLDGKQDSRIFPLAPLKKAALARLSPDGKTAAVLGYTKDDDEGEAVVLVNLADGKIQHIAAGNPEAFPTDLVFTPDAKRFAIGLRDGSAEIFETVSAQSVRKLPPYGEGGDVGALAFSPDGTLLAGGGTFDDSLFVWSADTGKVMRTITLPDGLEGYRIVTAVAVSHDKKTLAAGLGRRAMSSGDIGPEAGGVLVFDLASGKLRFALRGHRATVTALTFSRDDKVLVSGSHDGTVRTWDRNTGKELTTAAMDRDGRWTVVTDAGFYAAPDGSDNAVSIVRGTRAVSAATARNVLSRPDLVEALLKGDPDGRYRAAAKSLDLSKLAPPR